jgi:thiosulfate/3-mercaptopyruvate sulfurtransferase
MPSAMRSFSTSRPVSGQYDLNTYLVSPTELHAAIKKNVVSKLSTAPKVVPLCASWFLPNDGRNGYDTFTAQRIPHARFFDLDAVKDPASPYPHMLPSAPDFAKAMGQLGIRRHDSVVVYDSKELGIFSAPRVGWTLQAFGHPNVHVLNNFRKWVDEGFPTESGEPAAVYEVDYPVPELDASKVVAFEQVREIAKEQGLEGAEEVQILDARSLGRWKGVDPEPREGKRSYHPEYPLVLTSLPTGLSSGHIPHSISLPITDLLDPATKTLLPAADLQAVLKAKNIDPSKPIIASCGTGVTAAIIDAALTEAGFPTHQRRLYDGSWTEWAQRVKPSENLIQKVE